MGKVDIEITFDNNPSAVFAPGQVIHGTVMFNVTGEHLELRGLHAKFKGKARVAWSEGGGNNRRTYSSKEKYFHDIMLLYGKLPHETSDKTELPPGEHFYRFQYHLPDVLPSSFEGKHGNITYSVKAVVDKPWAFDIEKKQEFTVVRQLDLNQRADAMSEVKESKQKTLCCLCCTSGPISAMLSVPRKGYVPGETLRVFAEIQNHSSSNMSQCYLKLYCRTEFYAESRENDKEKELGRIQGPPLAAGESHQFHGDTLAIPPDLVASYLMGCNIMDVRYYLKAVVDPSGPSFKLEVPLEIIIGTIPHRLAVESAPPRHHGNTPASGQKYGVPSVPSPQYGSFGVPNQQYGVPSLPPPNYDSVASSGGDDQKGLDFSSAFDYGDKKE